MPWLVLAVVCSAVVLAIAADLFEIRRKGPWGHPDPRVYVLAWTGLLMPTGFCWWWVLAESSWPLEVMRACLRYGWRC